MIRFGAFEMSLGERKLRSGGRPLALRERAFDVLLALVERPGEVVSKGELCRRAWPERDVDENNLQVEVSALRKLLGAHAIVTAPGRGYQFTLPVEAQATRLLGREEDLAALEGLLAPASLLTVVGEGGVGKTRVVEALLKRVPSDACMLALDTAQPTTDLWRALALALQLRLSAREGVAAGVQTALRERRLLLVLDGCEPAVQQIAEFTSALMGTCAGVSLLATSRELLRVPGEHVYSLPALSPAAASALLEERLRALAQDAVSTDAQRADARDICQYLDGNPLAIELAARRASVCGLAQLQRSIEQRLDFSQDLAPDAPLRQRSMRASLAWSYGLLSSAERHLLHLLAGLPQPFTLDELLALPFDAWDAVETLGRLADKSWVAVEGERQPSYRLSRTTLLYACETREP